MNIKHFFNNEQVIFLTNTDKKMAIKEMIAKMEELGKIKMAPRYYAQVIHRESLENTGIGKGLAIPHARTESLTEFTTLLGIAPDGIDYMSYDNKPVKFILLSLFPTEMSTKYLYLVSMISKIFSDEDKRNSINNLTTSEEIFDFLLKNSEDYNTDINTEKNNNNELENLSNVPTSDLDLLIRLDRLYKYYEDNESEQSKVKIDELRKLIDNRSLTYYERMYKKCKNPFAIVEKSACSGCNMNIPPIELNEIKENNKISICSHCGRFLITL